MARDVSIKITAVDNFSSVIGTVHSTLQSFNSDLEKLDNALRAFGGQQITVDLNLDSTNNQIVELKTNLAEADKTFKAFNDTQAKAENRALSSSASKEFSISGLLGSNVGKMLGSSLSDALKTNMISSLGETQGTIVSTIISDTIKGAVQGSAIPGIPPILNNLVGAGIGFVSGAVKSFTLAEQQEQARDEAIKSAGMEMRNAYFENAETNLNSDADTERELYRSRERVNSVYEMRMDDEVNLTQMLGEFQDQANRSQFFYEEVANFGLMLDNYGFDNQVLSNHTKNLVAAGVGLGWNTADLEDVIDLLGDILNSEIATEDQIANFEKYGIATDGIYSDRLSGDDAVTRIFDFISEEYKGAYDNGPSTVAGRDAQLTGLNQNVMSGAGEAYENALAPYVQDEIDSFANEDHLKASQDRANLDAIYKASQQGIQMEISREIQYAMMQNDISVLNDLEYFSEEQKNRISEYAQEISEALATGDHETAAWIAQMIDIEAEIAYYNTEGMQRIQTAKGDMIANTSRALAEDPNVYLYGYEIGAKLGEGFIDAVTNALAFTEDQILEMRERNSMHLGPGDLDTYYPLPSTDSGSDLLNGDFVSVRTSAYGLPYVPYDDYVIRLHEGERVLTAQEARAYNSGKSIPHINIAGEYHVREEADIYKIAQALASQLQHAQLVS